MAPCQTESGDCTTKSRSSRNQTAWRQCKNAQDVPSKPATPFRKAAALGSNRRLFHYKLRYRASNGYHSRSLRARVWHLTILFAVTDQNIDRVSSGKACEHENSTFPASSTVRGHPCPFCKKGRDQIDEMLNWRACRSPTTKTTTYYTARLATSIQTLCSDPAHVSYLCPSSYPVAVVVHILETL